jgi:2-hydroxychromene-2-carboxylate isomerase
VSVFRAEFGEGRRIDDPAVIGDILDRLAVPAGSVLEAAQSSMIKTKLRTETEEAQRLQIFGAPTFVTADGELFWGNDRLERALAWAKRAP